VPTVSQKCNHINIKSNSLTITGHVAIRESLKNKEHKRITFFRSDDVMHNISQAFLLYLISFSVVCVLYDARTGIEYTIANGFVFVLLWFG
jgi:hypothetical protein